LGNWKKKTKNEPARSRISKTRGTGCKAAGRTDRVTLITGKSNNLQQQGREQRKVKAMLKRKKNRRREKMAWP